MFENLNRKYNQFLLSYAGLCWVVFDCGQMAGNCLARCLKRSIKPYKGFLMECYKDGQETGRLIAQVIREW